MTAAGKSAVVPAVTAAGMSTSFPEVVFFAAYDQFLPAARVFVGGIEVLGMELSPVSCNHASTEQNEQTDYRLVFIVCVPHVDTDSILIFEKVV